MSLDNVLQTKRVFMEYEIQLWEELALLKERLPPVEVRDQASHPPLYFEVELHGLRLFGDLFDGIYCNIDSFVEIPRQIPVATGKKEKELYLYSIHSSLRVLKQTSSFLQNKRERKRDGTIIQNSNLKRFCNYRVFMTNKHKFSLIQHLHNNSLCCAF